MTAPRLEGARFRGSEIKEGRKKDHGKRSGRSTAPFSVILGGFEPPTSCLSSKRSKPTELKDHIKSGVSWRIRTADLLRVKQAL